MKLKYLLIALPLLLVACNNNNRIKIEGSLQNKEGVMIYLDRLDVEKVVRIDSSKVSSKGTFSFVINSTETNFYQLGLSALEFVTLLPEPGAKVHVEFKGSPLQADYVVKGCENSEKIRDLDIKLFRTLKSLDSLQTVYNNALDNPGIEDIERELTQQYLTMLKEQRKFNIGFVIENISSLTAIKALYQRIDEDTYVLYDPKDLQYLKIVSDSLKKYYPASPHTKALIENVQMELNRFYMAQLSSASEDLREADLNITLPDPYGKELSLSSLKGKHVLLLFWSAKSQDCIALNLELKEYYKKYKPKGLEIYAVNLDQEEIWKGAVRFDELPWINVREQDPSNPASARLYNVTQVPTLFLIGKDGIVLNRDLSGRTLRIALDQIFGN